MSDPESTITLERFVSTELIVAGTCAACEPKKEHPGGQVWCFFNTTCGLDVEGSLEIE